MHAHGVTFIRIYGLSNELSVLFFLYVLSDIFYALKLYSSPPIPAATLAYYIHHSVPSLTFSFLVNFNNISWRLFYIAIKAVFHFKDVPQSLLPITYL